MKVKSLSGLQQYNVDYVLGSRNKRFEIKTLNGSPQFSNIISSQNRRLFKLTLYKKENCVDYIFLVTLFLKFYHL